MNNLSSITANSNPDMSNSEACELVESILSGKASASVAYEMGMKIVAYACGLVGSCDYSNIANLDREQTGIELDKISNARNYVSAVQDMFIHYPLVFGAIINLSKTIGLAECFLTPAFMLENKSFRQPKQSVCTYFIRHQDTKLIKIGRTINIESRIQALECGSGGKLELLAVINGDKENELHKKFSKLKVHKEWFIDENEVITKYINSALEAI